MKIYRFGWERFVWRFLIIILVVSVAGYIIERVVNLNVARPCTATERQTIQHYIANIPENKPKPKAAIHYLIQSNPKRIQKLTRSLQLLDTHFNNVFNYPVILFHENDLRTDLRQRLIDSTNSRLIFQNVSFTIPDFIQKPVPETLFGKTIGYRHMCRFQAMGIYDQPIMRHLDYAWRLDDDSFILSDIPYDIFRYMSDNDILYGYIQINYESRRRSRNLWEFVQSYIQQNNIKTHNFDRWPVRQQYYNNFEVSATKMWFSKEYQDYMHAVDNVGGIYHNMWGDATIKAIGVSMFVPVNKTHYFCDIAYEHENLLKGSW